MKIILSFIFLLNVVGVNAQLKNFADCKNAQLLNIAKDGLIGVFPKPVGPGELIEISDTKKSAYYFEKEHNTSWFKFGTLTANKFVFEIIPESPTDDFDFILFKVDPKTDVCEQIKLKKNIPLRTNIARGDTSYHGKTGLKLNAENDFKTSGKGNPYSSYIDIKPSEVYYLVIDKYKASEFGFSINLNYEKEILISGKIVDETKKSMQAEISLSDENGREIYKAMTDKKGYYEIKTAIKTNKNYLLTAYNDSSFIESKTINTNELKKTPKAYENISMVLPKLKKGQKYVVSNFNFYGNSAELLGESVPIQHNLFKLMSKNKNLKIVIEGHVNGPNSPNTQEFKELSKLRSETVYNYLISKGIAANRMSKEWFGNSKMLFPTTKDEIEMSMNRRVEIKVVEF